MYLTEQNKFSFFTDQTHVVNVKLMTMMKDIKQGVSWKVVNVKLMTIMKDIKQGVSWKVGNETLIWSSLLMPEMSGKFKTNPTKINKLIFIMMGSPHPNYFRM